MRQIHRQEGSLRDLSRHLVLGRRSRNLRDRHHRVAGHHGFHRIVVGWGMVGLVDHMVLGSAKDWERNLAGVGIVVEGSRLEEGRSLVAGEEGACLRSLVQGDKVSAMEMERSWVEEDREIGFEGGIVVGLHNLVEGDSHPEVGCRCSNRYSTL